jgi:hypothetical protein
VTYNKTKHAHTNHRPKYRRRAKAFAAAESLESRVLLTSLPYTWQNVNIGGGGFLDGIFFDPSHQNTIYARTDIGGLFKTTNGNAGNATRWQELLDFTNNATSNGFQQMGVLAFAMDPQNTNNIYTENGMYSGSTGWLMRSTNGGQTFSQISLPFYVGGNSNGRATGERLAVDPHLGSILFVGSNDHGLYKSTNSGVSVSAVTTFPSSTADIDFVTFDPTTGTSGNATQTIYVGVDSTAAGTNIYRSTNGGTSWSLLAGTGAPTGLIPMRGVYASGGFIYFTFSNALPPNGNLTAGAVYRYTISSGTWNSISPQTPGGANPTFGYDGIAIDPSNPTAVVVTSFDRYSGPDTIWRTANATVATPTWVQLMDFSSAQNFGFGGYNTTRDTSAAPWVAGFGDGIGNWAGSAAIDPFNSAHLMYGTGQGLWATDHGNSATKLTAAGSWYFPDTGIEFTAVGGVAAPSTGVSLISAMGDIFGFAHTTLTQSPAAGAGLYFGSGNSVDFAGTNPNFTALVGSISNNGNNNNGAFSTNGGVTYTQFASSPTSATGGTVAVTASGSTMNIVWAPSTQAPSWSTDHGTTWTASTGGLPTGGMIVADRLDPNHFYYWVENSSDNQWTLYVSTDAGHSFTSTPQIGTGNATLMPSPYTAGDLWLSTYGGLYHSTNFGASFTHVGSSSMQANTNTAAIGAPAPGNASGTPSIYTFGTFNGVQGVFRSDDAGTTWAQINDAAHQWGGLLQTMAADPNVFGRVFFGINGRGIIMGNPAVSLPAGWTDQDINTPGNPGWATSSTTRSDGTTVNQWTATGNGGGISGTADQFNLASRSLSGDYSISAQLTALAGSPADVPQAGVMFRAGSASGDVFAAMLQTSGNQLRFVTRATTGGGVTTTTLGSIPVGAEYVRILRNGNSFSGHYGTDGTNWTQLGSSVTIGSMPATALGGLGVTSADNAMLAAATFANVQAAAVVTTATISGTVWVDNNSNGTIDAGESGLAGVTVFLNGNGGEINTTTAADGSYTFNNVTAGSYTLREGAPVNYIQTTPSNAGTIPITALAGTTYANNNFGDFPTAFTGGSGGDNYYVRLNSAGTMLEIDLSNTPLATPTYTIGAGILTSLSFNGGGGSDTLAVDFTNGNPVPTSGLSFDGGTGSGDALNILCGNGSDSVSVGGSTVIVGLAAPIAFANTDAITVTTGAGNDTLTQAAQPTGATLNFAHGTGSDALDIAAGSYTFSTDPGANLTVDDAGALAFAAGPTGGGINPLHLAGLTIESAATAMVATPPNHSDRSVLVLSALSIGSSNASLDLGGNDMIVRNGDVAAITSRLATGIATGPWTGPGINSSAAASDASHLTALGVLANNDGAGHAIYGNGTFRGPFDGQDAAAGDVLVKYTYYGDADLSGAVDGADYSLIDNGFNAGLTGWVNGDFNYSNSVDGADYALIDNTFNSQPATPLAVPTTPSAVSDTGGIVTSSRSTGMTTPFVDRAVNPIAISSFVAGDSGLDFNQDASWQTSATWLFRRHGQRPADLVNSA